jgi:hypothetical protein
MPVGLHNKRFNPVLNHIITLHSTTNHITVLIPTLTATLFTVDSFLEVND